ncbi:MAG: hypothetical protein OEX00_06370 [Gammaproteobacteria bacterium]|nr:hypothetical protein [Gammaproteobacteria bacterium]MDH5693031.1 hypothetical protein [Gammaproteobacteria bacterium]
MIHRTQTLLLLLAGLCSQATQAELYMSVQQQQYKWKSYYQYGYEYLNADFKSATVGLGSKQLYSLVAKGDYDELNKKFVNKNIELSIREWGIDYEEFNYAGLYATTTKPDFIPQTGFFENSFQSGKLYVSRQGEYIEGIIYARFNSPAMIKVKGPTTPTIRYVDPEFSLNFFGGFKGGGHETNLRFSRLLNQANRVRYGMNLEGYLAAGVFSLRTSKIGNDLILAAHGATAKEGIGISPGVLSRASYGFYVNGYGLGTKVGLMVGVQWDLHYVLSLRASTDLVKHYGEPMQIHYGPFARFSLYW